MTPTTLTTDLPEISSEYPLPVQSIANFRRDGHVLVPGLATAEEIASYRPSLVNVVRQHSAQLRKLEERDTYGKAFIQIGNLWEKDAICKRFVFARRFAKVAADLMGVQGVRMYHDQALFKEGHGGFTPYHQDQFYWPIDNDNSITMWMPLVNVTPEMGTMTFASGSHRDGYLSAIPISDQSEEFYQALVKEKGYPLVTMPAMNAGDATFHYGWTLHGAAGNPTHTMREVMTIIWIADDSRVAEPVNEAQKYDTKVWFPGLKPGDLAASEKNPVVYRR